MPKQKNDRSTAEIHLGYFKQGDDLSYHIEKNPKHPTEALKSFADQLAAVADHLDAIRVAISSVPDVELYGNTHYCSITGPCNIIEDLIEKGLADKPYEKEEEEEEGDND